MQLFTLSLLLVTVFAGPTKTVRSKTGVFMNSVLVIGPDAHVGLYNHGEEEVDLSGWSLNHENDAAKKGDWTLPDGTSIGPGESLVIANSATAYQAAHGKKPDLEIGTGEGITDDDDVANVLSADGAGIIRSSDDEDGALVLRDPKGALKGHIGFRPDSPAHIIEERSQWKEIPTAAELGEAVTEPSAAGDAGVDQAQEPGALTASKGQNQEPKAAGSNAAAAAPAGDQAVVTATETIPEEVAEAAASESSSLWLWLSAVLALALAGFFWFRREE